jgi:hypothetical protein
MVTRKAQRAGQSKVSKLTKSSITLLNGLLHALLISSLHIFAFLLNEAPGNQLGRYFTTYIECQ